MRIYGEGILKNKIKYYSLNEVKKHNTIESSWTIYNNSIYDITEFINYHPGGKIIYNSFGKDITKLFDIVGHSKYAKNKLNEYYIGELKN